MKKTKILVESAVMICLASVLSLVPIFKMPLGGSVTLLSMLPICLISLKYGIKQGLFTAFIYSLIQLLLDISALSSWGLTIYTFIGAILFDYVFAFTSLGFSGIFGKVSVLKAISGIIFSMVFRFISHLISGTIFFASFTPPEWNPFVYSVVYNIAYMLPEMLLTSFACIIILKLPQIKKILD